MSELPRILHGEILPPGIPVTSRLRFDPTIARMEYRPEGERLDRIVSASMPGATDEMLDRVTVTLVTDRGEWVVPRANWHLVVPKAGTRVDVRVVVAGGAALRAVLSIAIILAATFIAGPYGFGFAVGSLAFVATTAVITAAGQLLINALVPLQTDSSDKKDTRYSISGTRNQASPWGPIPHLLGSMRVTPPFAAGQYTEVVGDDIFLRALFPIGYGPLSLTDFRFGDTPLDHYTDVQTEIRYGYADDTPVTLYPEVVFEEQIGAELDQIDGWTTRRTASKVNGFSIDIGFPQGLFSTKDDGSLDTAFVTTEWEYRRIDPATGVPDSFWTYIDTITNLELKTQPFRRTIRVEVSEVARYEVRGRRDTPDGDDNSNISDIVQWAVLRSIRHVFPLSYPIPIAYVAIRIKASKQLNGVIDQFNCLASVLIPDWDSGTSTWITRATQNPASIFRYLLQGPATALPRTDDEIDLAALEEWHEWCDTKGLRYNRYHDFDGSLRDTLAAVAAVGRATLTQAGGLWSVVIDRPQTIVRGHVSSRNAYQISGERNYQDLPDHWRIRYLDQNNDWKPDEILVPRPGYSGDAILVEQIEFPGKTTYVENYREGLRRFAELQLRPETWYATQDWENLFAPRGSLVQLSYPVLASTQTKSARVKAINGHNVTIDEPVTMDGVSAYACRFRLSDGTSSLWAVTVVDDTVTTFRVTGGSAALPDVGDLAFFGLSGSESFEAIVKSIEPIKDMAARLTLVPHAPTIESIADGTTIPDPPGPPGPPSWAGDPPAVPLIVSIKSGSEAKVPGVDAPVVIHVAPGGGPVPVHHYVVTAQRGVETPIVVTVPGSTGRAEYDSYSTGDVISIIAHAVSPYSHASADCTPVSYTIKVRTDGPASIATLAYSALSGGIRRFAWTLDPAATADQVAAVAGYEVRAKPGSGWAWADLAPLRTGLAPGSPYDTAKPFTAGAHTIGVASVDHFGTYCVHPKVVDVTLGTSSATILASRSEATTWPGLLSEGSIVAGELVGNPVPLVGQLDFSNANNSAWLGCI